MRENKVPNLVFHRIMNKEVANWFLLSHTHHDYLPNSILHSLRGSGWEFYPDMKSERKNWPLKDFSPPKCPYGKTKQDLDAQAQVRFDRKLPFALILQIHPSLLPRSSAYLSKTDKSFLISSTSQSFKFLLIMGDHMHSPMHHNC